MLRVPHEPTRRLLARAQVFGVAIAILAAAGFFARWVNDFYPIEQWLLWRYSVVWLETLLFGVAALSTGVRLVSRLQPKLSAGERIALAMPLGVLVFFMGTFVVGVLGGYGRAFFIVWPLLMMGMGAPVLVAWGTQLTRRAPLLSALVPRTGLQIVFAGVLLLGLLGIYLQIINPHQIGYDAHWYHMPIAETYVAAGRIVPFKEGWYLGTYPQLANLLFVWAFEAPGDLPLHILLCEHLEFLIFAATLLSVGVLSAQLVRRERLPYAAAIVFLFPEVFAYDSNLNGGADHVLAFWVAALGIALLRLGACFSQREAVLAGLVLAGALLTKYQAAYVLVPALLLVGGLAIRTRRLRVTLTFAAVTAIVTSPHWLKNWIYYHDPLYPLLHHYLPAQPFHAGAARLFEDVYWPKRFALQGAWGERLVATLRALVSFSFVPNDWPEFHGSIPIFGSLFTLSLPLLLLLRTNRRIWLMAAGAHIGIAIWYITSHQDRFLQALLPWMAATTAALLYLGWQKGWFVRGPIALLVCLQWAWGSDVYFFRSHNMLGDSAIRASAEYLGAVRGAHQNVRPVSPTLTEIGSRLPISAKVLFHRERLRLGLGRQFVEDSPGWQGAIEYLDLATPVAANELLRQLGVTHVMWQPNQGGFDRVDLARQASFVRLVATYLEHAEAIDGWQVGELGRAIPGAQAQAPTVIAWLVCGNEAQSGLYTPRGLAEAKISAPWDPRGDAGGQFKWAAVNVAITQPHCEATAAVGARLTDQFSRQATSGEYALWVRVHPGN